MRRAAWLLRWLRSEADVSDGPGIGAASSHDCGVPEEGRAERQKLKSML